MDLNSYVFCIVQHKFNIQHKHIDRTLHDIVWKMINKIKHDLQLSFIDPERGGFGKVFPEVMIIIIINIITEGNVSPNLPNGGSINDILYRKTKMFMQNV